MQKQQLLECGIAEDCIEVVPDEQEATLRALTIAESGDLILVLADNVKRSWKQIIYFNSDAKEDTRPKKAPVTIHLPDVGGFTLDDDLEIISDERGVRIAREEGD